MVRQWNSGRLFSVADCSKNPWIENQSSSSQSRSLHGFWTSHFICYLYGFVPWLGVQQVLANSIKNYIFIWKKIWNSVQKSIWNSLREWLPDDTVIMTGRDSNLDSNLNSAAWPTGCKDSICSEISEWTCGFWILFRSVENAEIEAGGDSIPTSTAASLLIQLLLVSAVTHFWAARLRERTQLVRNPSQDAKSLRRNKRTNYFVQVSHIPSKSISDCIFLAASDSLGNNDK